MWTPHLEIDRVLILLNVDSPDGRPPVMPWLLDNESDVSCTRDDQLTGILPMRPESKLAVML
jgi:hypothetical protein